MTIKLEKLERYAYGPMQFAAQSVDDMRVGDMLDFVRDIPAISNDISAISKELLDARAEIEQLKAELLLAVKLIDHAYCKTGPTDWQMQKEAWDFWRRHMANAKEAT